MRIDLFGVKHFVAGGQIQGIVHIDLKQKFEAYSVTVKLEGKDEVSQVVNHGKHSTNHKTKRVLVNEAETVVSFPDTQLQPQVYSFPFTLIVPQVIPQTMSTHIGGFYIKIKYTVKAQLVPV